MASFDLRQLEYFVQAVDDKNLSIAAKNLFVSHQALSKGIHNLEVSLGIALLDRGNTGVMPTEFGATFYEKAAEIIRRANALEGLCESYRHGAADSVRMGFIPGCLSINGGTVHTEDLLRFQDEHPTATCAFRDITTEALERDFDKGRIDLATSMTGFDTSKFEGKMLWDYPVAAILSSANPISAMPYVSLEDLADETFVIPSEYYDEFHRVCSAYDFHPDYSALQTALGWNEQVIHDNNVVTVYPLQHSARIFKRGPVSIIPIVQDGKPVTYPLFIIWRKGEKLSQVQASLRDYVFRLYQETHPSPEELRVFPSLSMHAHPA